MDLYEEMKLHYGVEIADSLLEAFKAYNENEYEYQDNHRFCQVGDKPMVKNFKEREKRGCCGNVCEVLKIKGKTYKIGFNYGH